MLGTTGTILRNPLDMGAGLGKDSLRILKETLELIAANPGIDAIMFNMWVTWERSEDIKKLVQMGIPTYPTIARAAKALANVKQYFENHLNEVMT